MRIAVCEFPDEMERKESAWRELVQFLRAKRADIVVLPEMPFCAWDMFKTRTIDATAWEDALAAHDMMIGRFGELNAGAVLSSRPITRRENRFNEGFCWTPEAGYKGVRTKYYLPDEPDGWEATWFSRGDRSFAPSVLGPVKVGFQICTELFFTEPAREIGRAGAHLIAAPRATGGHRRWPTAASMTAIVSGCFVASSNRRSSDGVLFAGRSWLMSPDADVLAETSVDTPYITVDVDLDEANWAKQTYPRNVLVP